MLMWILLGLIGILLCIFLYKHFNEYTKYWSNKGITHIKALPIIGGMSKKFFKRKSFPDVILELYQWFPNAKYFGFHQLTTPILMIRDPKLIKLVTVKDFDSFMNHRIVIDDDESLFGKNLLSLQDQKWKNMRSKLSPAFTGSKMRIMSTLINDCANKFVQYFLNKAKEENDTLVVEMKDIFMRYTTDVIATTAFGIECDSLTNQNNEFFTIGKNVLNFSYIALIKIFAFLLCPKLMKFCKIPLTDKKMEAFFREVITSNLRTREKEGIFRPDIIHLLMEARKGCLKHESSDKDTGFATVEESHIGTNEEKQEITDDDIVAQAFLFFFAGYETSSTMMSFMAYELALNPDVQKKLQEEIDNFATNGDISYELIVKMKYLDMVVSESLRKWPPAILMERQCKKPFLIQDANEDESPALIEKNISVWIPVFGIHRDPQYFPDPDKFIPERFNDENKEKILPFTYLPFGAGPRNCIGSRFALLEIKMLFVHILSKFDLVVVKKTQIPLKFSKAAFNITTEKGIWLGLKPRN